MLNVIRSSVDEQLRLTFLVMECGPASCPSDYTCRHAAGEPPTRMPHTVCADGVHSQLPEYDASAMDDPDLVLLDRWCEGDQAAGNELFKRHFESLYRFFDQKTSGDDDDLVQETFTECLKSRGSFKRQASFRTYLFAIARHVLYAHWKRKVTARPTIDFEDISIESLSTSMGSRMVNREDRSRLHAAMRTLPVDQQLLLELHYFQDLDATHLSEVFSVEPTTIRTRLHRARQTLQTMLASSASADEFDAWARNVDREDPIAI